MAEAAPVAAPAAPSAPAPDGPSAQPVAAPDIQAVNTDSPLAKRTAKPIPSRPGLPGVLPDDDSAQPSAEGTAPSRGPDGRFLASPSSATPPSVGEHTLEPGQPDSAEFTFAGEKFASREVAEQNFKSLRGQFKPIQSLARSLGGVDKVVPHLTRAAESARGWKAEADRLSAELAARSGQPANPAATPDTQAEPDVDWEFYAEIAKQAAASGEPWMAEKWLVEETRKAERARVEKLLDERLAPFHEQQAQQELEAGTSSLFGGLAEYTLDDGSPAFPELSDESSAYSIGKLWASMGLPPEAALTPQGAIAAIAIYRMVSGSQARTEPAAPPTAVPPSPILPTDTRSAAGFEDGRPTVASVPGNGNTPSAEAARILSALRQSRSSNRAALGFEA